MKVKIVDIDRNDEFYESRGGLIGRTGEWLGEINPVLKWQTGHVLFDNSSEIDSPLNLPQLFFVSVKIEPALEVEVKGDPGKPLAPIRDGHPDFYKLCEEEMDLHDRKNHDYSSGGHPLGNFNRVAAILALYPGLKPSNPAIVAVTYMLKQLDASLWMLSNGHQAKVEGHNERWRDVSVYSKLISILISEKK